MVRNSRHFATVQVSALQVIVFMMCVFLYVNVCSNVFGSPRLSLSLEPLVMPPPSL